MHLEAEHGFVTRDDVVVVEQFGGGCDGHVGEFSGATYASFGCTPGMSASRRGHPLQVAQHGLRSAGVSAAVDLVLLRAALRIERGQQLAGLVGQGHRERAPVVGVRHALDQALLLQLVDDADHHVAVDAELGRQLTLRLAVVLDQRLQHRIRAGFDAERRQPAHEILGEIDAQLGQQKRNPLVQLGDAGRAFVIHEATLAPTVIVI